MIRTNVYKNGCRHILTMSYDDGQIHDRRLVEIFNKYGIRGTFHLNSGCVDNDGFVTSDDVRNLYKNHEVACHTVNHPWLEKMPEQSVLKEIMEDRAFLEPLCGYPVRGMSYPFGTHNVKVREIARNCGIVYSRTADSNPWFGIPSDFMQWSGTCHHNGCIDAAKSFIGKTKGGNPWFSGLFYVWGHSFEFARENNWDMIEEFCKMMSGREDTWYATNIEIYDYITAQRALRISVDEKIIENPTAIDVWIEKDREIVKIPAGQTVRF